MSVSRRVVVVADDRVLRRLADVLPGPVKLTADRDGWAITAPEIDQASSAEEARNIANSIAAQLSGLARLESKWAAPLKVAHVAEEDSTTGQRNVFVFVEDSIRMVGEVAAVTVIGNVPAPRRVSDIERGMTARHEPRVALVLELLAEPPSWPGLYKVLDAIEEDVGGERALESRGWVPPRELKRFTQAANAIENARRGGRHAKSRYTLATSTRAMSLDDAWELVTELVRHWLQEKSPVGATRV
jgi:hypothetical protein